MTPTARRGQNVITDAPVEKAGKSADRRRENIFPRRCRKKEFLKEKVSKRKLTRQKEIPQRKERFPAESYGKRLP